MDLDYKAIGMRVKQARSKRELTQDNVAEAIGVSTPHMSNIERGSTKVGLPTLVAIANVLNVSSDELLCDNLIKSKAIYEYETYESMEDGDPYEVRVMAEMVKATKAAMRKHARFRNNIQ